MGLFTSYQWRTRFSQSAPFRLPASSVIDHASAAIIEQLGFFGIDLGLTLVGSKLARFPGGPLPSLDLVRFD
ncbi:hypothetical protein CHELA20_10861 [Hyphomicrobiales bacterium]|nr:hypothetical protein CHELA20_10861 [Hyphomicrobiales bacterium]CAH1694018.1 hypothetical protein CHELA41_51092 [Hyphomicrobiales bacterium]